MISKLIPESKVRGWLGKEYWEVAKSVILVGSIFSILTFISGLGISLTGSGTPGTYSSNIQNLVSSSESYLCTVNNQVNLAINNVVPLIIGIGFLKSIQINYEGFPIPPVPIPIAPELPVLRAGISFKLFDNLLYGVAFTYLGFGLSAFLDMLLFLIIPAKVFFAGQVLILPYLVSLGLIVLIPTGLIMRAFPFSRGIGGTLIAFGIGIAIVWPTILILFNAPISNYFCRVLSTNYCLPLGPSPSAAQTTIQLYNAPETIQATSECNGATLGLGATGNVPGGLLLALVCQPLANWWISTGYTEFSLPWQSAISFFPSLNVLLDNSLYLDLQFFVLFILDLLIAYTITDNIAKMLGGTIRVSLGNKLKLV